MSNWQIVYQNSPGHIQKFIRMIPPEDLNSRSLEGAVHYVKEKWKQREREFTMSGLELTPGENPYKFSSLKNREEPQENKKNISQKKYEEAVKTGDSEKLVEVTAKNVVDIANMLGAFKTDSLVTFQSITLPRRTILLDSRNRNPAVSDYSWNIVPYDSKQRGEVGARDSISQIVEVRSGPFRIPIVPGSNMTYYDKVRVGIQQLNTQGVEIAAHLDYAEKNYFHFEYETTAVSAGYLELRPVQSWKPAKVISMLDIITLNFYGNTDKIDFLPDRYFCAYTAGPPAVFTTTEPHFLNTGDLVYIGGPFYNKQGYLIAVLSATTFQILGSAPVAGSIEVYCASRRIQIKLDFILLEN
jgi:hypothetical protein